MSSVNDALLANDGALAKIEAAQRGREESTKALLTAPIKPTLIRLSAPNIIAMIVSTVTSIAEAMYAAQMGESALAGQALVFPLFMLTQMLAAGAMGGAITSSVARAVGARDPGRAEQVISHAFIIVIAMAFLSAVLNILYGSSFFSLLGGKNDVLRGAVEYAAVFFPGCVFIWLCHGALSVIRGTGEMKFPSLVLLVISLGVIPLQGALSLGWGPFPAMGMAGLATASVIAFGAGTVAALLYLAAGKSGLGLTQLFAGLKADLFGDILRAGLIASVGTLLTMAATIVVTGLVGQFGKDALAGFGLGARLEFILIPLVFGIGAALTSMVGANIGAGNRERALTIAWTGAVGAALFVGIVGVVLAMFPGIWLGLFLRPEQTAIWEAGALYFHIVAPGYAFLAFGLSMFFASQGAGKVLLPTLAGVIRTVLVIGGAIYLVKSAGTGIEGIFYAIVTGMVVLGILTPASVKLTGWK